MSSVVLFLLVGETGDDSGGCLVCGECDEYGSAEDCCEIGGNGGFGLVKHLFDRTVRVMECKLR